MNNLKPFNLPEALAGKAVMLRDGRKAYVRHHETEVLVEEDMRLTGLLLDGIWMAWCESGHFYGPDKTNSHDIIGMYPETRIINGFEVPAPETEPLTYDTRYYVPLPADVEFYDVWHWTGSDFDLLLLERGLIFLSGKDAIATTQAMLGIDPYSETE